MSDIPTEIPPVAGRPAVTARSSKDKMIKGAVLIGLALAVAVGGMAAWYKLSSDEGEAQSDQASLAEQSAQSAYTSSRNVTFTPLPPEPEPEPVKVKEPEPEPAPAAPAPQVIMQVPALPRAELDESGEAGPTLDELKFAAPMMGAVQNAAKAEEGGSRRVSSDLGYDDGTHEGRDLSRRLQSVATPQSAATRLKNQSMILSKGTVIECILETRVDTTVPGMTSCIIPRDIYSMNGRVLLVEKGTKAVGEYQGSVANGLARIFMLWTELRTPHGVVVRLNSPAADALGGAGMGGYVDYHWWQRFGSALLFSLISDAWDYVITTANNSDGDVTYDNTDDSITEMVREAMRYSGQIPPTLIKNQGERVSIFVARDLSFENVYGIKTYGSH